MATPCVTSILAPGVKRLLPIYNYCRTVSKLKRMFLSFLVIAANLILIFCFTRPQGGHHTVVRWIHRSKFRIRPNPFTKALIPIPGTLLSIDPGWYGYVIVETEGTNEGLADLQDRCRGIGFPPRAGAPQNKPPSKVFRLLRERRFVSHSLDHYTFD